MLSLLCTRWAAEAECIDAACDRLALDRQNRNVLPVTPRFLPWDAARDGGTLSDSVTQYKKLHATTSDLAFAIYAVFVYAKDGTNPELVSEVSATGKGLHAGLADKSYSREQKFELWFDRVSHLLKLCHELRPGLDFDPIVPVAKYGPARGTTMHDAVIHAGGFVTGFVGKNLSELGVHLAGYDLPDRSDVSFILWNEMKRATRLFATSQKIRTPEEFEVLDGLTKNQRKMMEYLLDNGPAVRVRAFENIKGAFSVSDPDDKTVKKTIRRMNTRLSELVNGWFVEHDTDLTKYQAMITLIRPQK